MSNASAIDWDTLVTKYGKLLALELKKSFDANESAAWSPESLGNRLNVDPDTVRALLDVLTEAGALDAMTARQCSMCGTELTDDNEGEMCAEDPDGGDHDGKEFVVYSREGARSADIGWVLTIHGMNTRGPWQERFSWRLARIYRHSVPVAIYKYGHILFTPLISWRQQAFADRLLVEIRARQAEARELGFMAVPTVIAHSFGTWLLARVLERSCQDQGDRINVGRVILTGSIIPPDFDWAQRIKQGQVEAVFCHYSPKDGPVGVAHWFIPDSGPSGRIGFNDVNSVVHKKEPGFGHSDYFKPEYADRIWSEAWQPFLRYPLTDQTYRRAGDSPDVSKKPWKPSRWRRITHLAKWLVLALLFSLGVTIVAWITYGALLW